MSFNNLKILNSQKLNSLELAYLKAIYTNNIVVVNECLEKKVNPFVCYKNLAELKHHTKLSPNSDYAYEERAERNLEPILYCIKNSYFDMSINLINKNEYSQELLETILYYSIYEKTKKAKIEQNKLDEIIYLIFPKIKKLSFYIESIFLISCKANFLPGVERCILDDVDFLKHQSTAFEMIIEKYCFQVVQYFIELTQNKELVDRALEMILNQPKIIEEELSYILEKGASFHFDPIQYLFLAIKNGHLNILTILKNQGINIYGEQHSSVNFCLRFVSFSSLKYLISSGEDIHCNNDIILKTSLQYGHTDILNIFIEFKLLNYVIDFVNTNPKFSKKSHIWLEQAKRIILKDDFEIKLSHKEDKENKEGRQKL